MSYVFKMAIGDIDGIGHHKCKQYLVLSNRCISEVEDLNYMIEAVLGIDLFNICTANNIIPPTKVRYLKAIGVDLNECVWIIESDGSQIIEPCDLINIWCQLLMIVDKELRIEVLPDNIPTLKTMNPNSTVPSYNIGYGCFKEEE